ncbi:hypothetical protein EDB83DRAFT_2525554 [Lactarius deliciosus]|nr:hypothetical protein EDB83DRAFT_2525554 [Lactarius deliciosus]
MDAPPPTPTTRTSNFPQTPQALESTTREALARVTTIQSACISVMSSPTAITAKNRKKCPTNDKDDQELQAANDLAGPTLAPTVTTIEIPAEAIQLPLTTPGHLAQIVHYPSSEPSHTPPPYALPPILDEDSPTPLATPTRPPRATPIAPLSQSTQDEDIPMIFAQLMPQESPTHHEQGTPPGNTTTTRRTATLVRGIVEADRVNPHVGGSNPLVTLDKFTLGPMPQVQDAHPTSIFEYLDLDLISDWENFQRGKLIAIPFNNDARDINMHEDIKARLMAAIAEITKLQDVGVASP